MSSKMFRAGVALAGAVGVAQAAALLLRPRSGLIAPDPVEAGEHFSAEEIARARRYGRPQLAIRSAAGLLEAGVLAALVARPPRVLTAPRERPLAAAAATGAGLSAAVGLTSLPLSALARRRALAAGLATQSWRGWAADVAKATALGSGLAGGASAAAVGLMRRHPRGWWLPGAGVAVAGAALLTFASPVLLDPIFNRFRPLPEGELRSDVLDLAERAGVSVGEVYEVDASRRTTAANAYVTGLGATKRVVLFDTLIESFTREEARLVVAHELAHVHHRDVRHGLAHMALVAPVSLWAAAQVARALDRGAAQEAPGATTLPALALAVGLVAAATGVISSQLSRRVEARADAYSLRLTDSPEPFVSFERKLVLANLADPDPPRWLVRLIASHPPAVERIGIARAYARGAR